MSNHALPRVIVALDQCDRADIDKFVSTVSPALCCLKVGKHAFTRFGPALVRELIHQKFSVFLDLKYHDIPNTVAEACKAAAEMGVWMLNVHVAGGQKMLLAAREAINTFPKNKRPLLIGVTVLTSLDDADLKQLGMHDSVENTVLRLAKNAKTAGLDGVVCSANEVTVLRKALGDDFLLVTPGIRLLGDDSDDQKRVMTPEAAFAAGADYIVMGRSIVQANDSVEKLKLIIGNR